MKQIKLRKTLNVTILLGVMSLATSALAETQTGYGMGYGMMCGYDSGWMCERFGGYAWLCVMAFLGLVTVGLITWFVAKKSN